MSVRCTKAVLNYPIKDIGFKAVLFALGDFANRRTLRCWPSLATLEAASGAGRSTVARKLDLAEKLTIITRMTRRDMSTVYTFSKDFVDRYGAEEEDEDRPHYRHSAKQVDPEPDFLGLMGASPTVTPPLDSASARAAAASPRAGAASPTVTPEPEEEPEEEPEGTLGGCSLKIRKESVADEFHRRWNEIASEHRVAKCNGMDENMRKKLITRLDGFAIGNQSPHDVMNVFFAAVLRSPFLLGQVAPTGNRSAPFRLNIGWALAPGNFAKIFNDAYDGDRDAAGNDISGPARVGPTAAAAANVRARFRSNPQR